MSLTVKQMINHLQKMNPDALVVLAKDREGNSYSPAVIPSEALYVAESTWSGEIFDLDDVDENDASELAKNSIQCVVIWPTN